jgi:hypothetical protein
MEIDVLHRQQLRVAAARRASLDAEHRSETRLAHAEHRVLSELPQRLRQSDRDGALAFTRWRRIDRCHEDETSLHGTPRDLEWDLRLVLAVQVEVIDAKPDLSGDVGDVTELRGLRDLDIGWNRDLFGHVRRKGSYRSRKRF